MALYLSELYSTGLDLPEQARKVAKRFARYFIAICALISLIILPGCGSEDGWTPQPPPAGFLRAVNTISDSPGFAVDFETQRIGFVNFSESTSFTPVLPSVTRTLLVSYAKDGQLAGLISRDIEIGVDNLTTVIIAGTMSEPELLIFNDLPAALPEDTTLAELRFAHASPNLPLSIDYHLGTVDAPSGDPLVSLSPNTVSEIINNEASIESLLQTFVTGQADPFWDSGSYPVLKSTRPLFILVDYFGPGSTNARTVSVLAIATINFPNELLESSNRLANMIPDVTAVDIYLDELLIGEDMLFGDIAGFELVEPGTYTIKVTTANSMDDVISEDPYTTLSGEFQTITTTGVEENKSIIVTTDDFRRVTNRSTLAITNSSPAAGSVDVYIMLPGQSIDDNIPGIRALSYPGHGNLRMIDGTYDLVLTDTGTQDIVFGPEQLSLESLGLYRVFITDSDGGGEPVNIILDDDFNPEFSP